jgi:hypothetical protein
MSGLVRYEQWREGNAGDRMAWAREMLERMQRDWQAMPLVKREQVTTILRGAK